MRIRLRQLSIALRITLDMSSLAQANEITPTNGRSNYNNIHIHSAVHPFSISHYWQNSETLHCENIHTPAAHPDQTPPTKHAQTPRDAREPSPPAPRTCAREQITRIQPARTAQTTKTSPPGKSRRPNARNQPRHIKPACKLAKPAHAPRSTHAHPADGTPPRQPTNA